MKTKGRTISRSASFKGTSTPTTRTPTYTLQDVKPTHQDEFGTMLVLSVDGQPLCTVLSIMAEPTACMYKVWLQRHCQHIFLVQKLAPAKMDRWY